MNEYLSDISHEKRPLSKLYRVDELVGLPKPETNSDDSEREEDSTPTSGKGPAAATTALKDTTGGASSGKRQQRPSSTASGKTKRIKIAKKSTVCDLANRNYIKSVKDERGRAMGFKLNVDSEDELVSTVTAVNPLVELYVSTTVQMTDSALKRIVSHAKYDLQIVYFRDVPMITAEGMRELSKCVHLQAAVFAGDRAGMSSEALQNLVQGKCGSSLRMIKFAPGAGDGEGEEEVSARVAAVMKAVADHCTSLHHLDLMGFGTLDDEAFKQLASIRGPLQTIRCPPTVTIAAVNFVKQKCASIRDVFGHKPATIDDFLAVRPEMITEFYALFIERISDAEVKKLVDACLNLTSLHISLQNGITGQSLRHIAASACAKRLVKLDAGNTEAYTPEDVKALATCINLEHLDLSWGCGNTFNPNDEERDQFDDALSLLAIRLTKLKKVGLKYCNISLRSVYQFPNTCKVDTEGVSFDDF